MSHPPGARREPGAVAFSGAKNGIDATSCGFRESEPALPPRFAPERPTGTYSWTLRAAEMSVLALLRRGAAVLGTPVP